MLHYETDSPGGSTNGNADLATSEQATQTQNVAIEESPTEASNDTQQSAETTDAAVEPLTDDSPVEAVQAKKFKKKAVDLRRSDFAALGLDGAVLAAVESSGYTTPTPIQAKTIPLLLEGRDVVGQAQTGTGKTAAFALPLLARVDTSLRRPQVLVLTPTRELAIQVAESFEKYAGNSKGLNVVSIYGGQDYQIQFRALRRGPQIVVGTPGRVMDHMRRGSLDLNSLQCLVLDEADEMLRMGFADDVEWVLTQAPKERQMALFSATMPAPIRRIAQQHLNDPSEITIAQKTATADTVHQRYLVVSPHQKQAALLRILEAESIDGVLIFVKTRSSTEPLAEQLAAEGFKTAALNGDIPQKRRERIIERLRSGDVDIIVATDVAARGLDVQRISHVINYDLPFDSEAYVHRIGRTGRAGRSGDAILFVHPRERRMLNRLEKATRQSIELMEPASNRAINKQRVSRFHDQITAALGHEHLEMFQSVIEQYQRDNDVPLELIAASMAVLANNEKSLFVSEKIKPAAFAPDSRGAGRGGRKERGGGRGNRGGAARTRPDDVDFATYRIEVGRNHNVQPGNIVGAIANEAGIGSELIGRIKINDQYSTVDLPGDLPQGILESLRSVFVSGRSLNISKMNGQNEGKYERNQDSPRRFNKAKGKFRKRKAPK